MNLNRWLSLSLCILVAGIYVTLIFHLTPYGYLDLPNHIARAEIIAALVLDNDMELSQFYDFQWKVTPYLIGDLILLSLIRLFGTHVGPTIWSVFVFLSVPMASILFLRRRSEAMSSVSIANTFLLTSVVGFNWMYMMGFFNFQLGIAAYLLALHFWLRGFQTDRKLTHPTANALTILLSSLLCFFIHLSSYFFLAVSISALALWKLANKTSLKLVLSQSLPIVLVGVVGVVFSRKGAVDKGLHGGDVLFTPLQNKIRYFVSLNERYSWQIDDLALVLLFAYLAFGLAKLAFALFRPPTKANASRLNLPIAFEFALLAATFAIAFLILPARLGTAVGFIDARAIPYGILSGILSVVLISSKQDKLYALAFPCVVVAVNLFSLWSAGIPYAKNVANYAALHQKIPKGQSLLPVTCERKGIGGHPFGFHAHSTYASRSKGLQPYLFSDTRGQPQEYFAYKNVPSATPIQTWCIDKQYIDLKPIAEQYEYILFDRSYIEHEPLVEQISNLIKASVLVEAHSDSNGIVLKSHLSGR